MRPLPALAVLALLASGCREGSEGGPGGKKETTPDGARPPVPFEGRDFVTDADLKAISFPFDERVREAVEYERRGDAHVYRLAGQVQAQLDIVPRADAQEALSALDSALKWERTRGTIGVRKETMVFHEVHEENLVGEKAWWSEAIMKQYGVGVIVIGFAKGPFFAKVIWEESVADRKDLRGVLERALRLAAHTAGKLH